MIQIVVEHPQLHAKGHRYLVSPGSTPKAAAQAIDRASWYPVGQNYIGVQVPWHRVHADGVQHTEAITVVVYNVAVDQCDVSAVRTALIRVAMRIDALIAQGNWPLLTPGRFLTVPELADMIPPGLVFAPDLASAPPAPPVSWWRRLLRV